jgi:hypothetical protein
MVDSEQEPSITVVTPWRSDSTAQAAQHLDVVVRVDVEHAWQHPLVGGIDHLWAAGLVQFVGGDRHHVAVRMPRFRTADAAPVPSNQRPLRMIES